MSDTRCLFAAPLENQAGSSCPPHDHNCTELVLFQRASGCIHEGERKLEYRDGSLVIHQPGFEHWVENKEGGIHFCIGVAGETAGALPIVMCEATEEIKQVYELIGREIAEVRSDRYVMLDQLASVLVILLKRLTDVESSEKVPYHVEKAKRILDSRFREPINLGEVASSLYISQDYLRQLFKQTYGDSPMHYLVRKRIDCACEMLRLSDQPIHEIAVAAGIENPYYFSRIFKKTKGCTPSEFRSRTKAL